MLRWSPSFDQNKNRVVHARQAESGREDSSCEHDLIHLIPMALVNGEKYQTDGTDHG